jgi:hypothetical protein
MIAARTGDSSGVGGAVASSLASIPVVGPYAPIIGLLAGIGYGIWQTSKRKSEVADIGAQLSAETTNLSNVVKSIEVASPDWNEQHKADIAAIQGPETSARVEEIKKESNL